MHNLIVAAISIVAVCAVTSWIVVEVCARFRLFDRTGTASVGKQPSDVVTVELIQQLEQETTIFHVAPSCLIEVPELNSCHVFDVRDHTFVRVPISRGPVQRSQLTATYSRADTRDMLMQVA